MINCSISKPSQKVLSQCMSILNNSFWGYLFLISLPPCSKNSCAAAPSMHIIPCIIIYTCCYKHKYINKFLEVFKDGRGRTAMGTRMPERTQGILATILFFSWAVGFFSECISPRLVASDFSYVWLYLRMCWIGAIFTRSKNFQDLPFFLIG